MNETAIIKVDRNATIPGYGWQVSLNGEAIDCQGTEARAIEVANTVRRALDKLGLDNVLQTPKGYHR